jgi:hypothetical protein
MPKAKLTTRERTTSNVSTDTLAKGTQLTHAEADSNFINLRDQSFGLADDSSTVLQVSADKTITVAGGTGITTALSGDTLTITGSNQAQGITFVGDDSSGTGISDGETIKIAGGANITTAMSGDTLTITSSGQAITVQEEGSSLATAAAVLDFRGTGVTATGTGSTKTITIPGEALGGAHSTQAVNFSSGSNPVAATYTPGHDNLRFITTTGGVTAINLTGTGLGSKERMTVVIRNNGSSGTLTVNWPSFARVSGTSTVAQGKLRLFNLTAVQDSIGDELVWVECAQDDVTYS